MILTEESALDQLIKEFNLNEGSSLKEQGEASSQALSHEAISLQHEASSLQEVPDQVAEIKIEAKSEVKGEVKGEAKSEINTEQQAKHDKAVDAITVEQESCGLRLASGRDELSMVATLYAQNQRLLLDHARLQTKAGLAGWQTDMSSQMLRDQVKRLAGRYAGQSPN